MKTEQDKRASVYVHLGDAEHRPTQTVRVTSKSMLRDLLSEARRDEWPAYVAVEGHGCVSVAEAFEALPARRCGSRPKKVCS